MTLKKTPDTSKAKEKSAISRRVFAKAIGVASLSLVLQPFVLPGKAKAFFGSETAQTPVNELQNMILNQLKSYKNLPDVSGGELNYALQDAKFQDHLGKHLFQSNPVSSVNN